MYIYISFKVFFFSILQLHYSKWTFYICEQEQFGKDDELSEHIDY